MTDRFDVLNIRMWVVVQVDTAVNTSYFCVGELRTPRTPAGRITIQPVPTEPVQAILEVLETSR